MNVICVMLDSLRADHVGAYGDRARTPNMNRIARESLVFSKAYSGSVSNSAVPTRFVYGTVGASV